MQQHYTYDKIVVGISGDIEHERFVEAVEKKFRKPQPAERTSYEPAQYIGGHARRIKDSDQTTFMLLFEGLSYYDPDYYAGEAVALIMGGCESSRFYHEVRRKRGMSYEPVTDTFNASDTGHFRMICISDNATAKKDVIPIICDQFLKAQDGFSDEEVHLTKQQLLLDVLSGLESPNIRSQHLAENLLMFDRIRADEEIIAAINDVTTEDMKRVAQRMFTSKPSYVTVGPNIKIPTYENVCERLNYR